MNFTNFKSVIKNLDFVFAIGFIDFSMPIPIHAVVNRHLHKFVAPARQVFTPTDHLNTTITTTLIINNYFSVFFSQDCLDPMNPFCKGNVCSPVPRRDPGLMMGSGASTTMFKCNNANKLLLLLLTNVYFIVEFLRAFSNNNHHQHHQHPIYL